MQLVGLGDGVVVRVNPEKQLREYGVSLVDDSVAVAPFKSPHANGFLALVKFDKPENCSVTLPKTSLPLSTRISIFPVEDDKAPLIPAGLCIGENSRQTSLWQLRLEQIQVGLSEVWDQGEAFGAVTSQS